MSTFYLFQKTHSMNLSRDLLVYRTRLFTLRTVSNTKNINSETLNYLQVQWPHPEAIWRISISWSFTGRSDKFFEASCYNKIYLRGSLIWLLLAPEYCMILNFLPNFGFLSPSSRNDHIPQHFFLIQLDPT